MLSSRLYTNPATAIPLDVVRINAASRTIDIAAYTLTETTVIGALCAAAARSVAIRLYLDRSEIEAEARHDDTGTRLPIHPLLTQPSVRALVKRSIVLMHLKSYCIDGLILRSGSANWSPLGETEQDNEASWEDDPAKIELFQAKFEAMWNRPDNLSIQQAIDLNREQGITATFPHRPLPASPPLPSGFTPVR